MSFKSAEKGYNSGFSLNSIQILQKRYLLKDKEGRIIETPKEMFKRISNAVAVADNAHQDADENKSEKKFYQLMTNLEFLPNSPTLMNAGTPINQLSACFVIPVKDSIEGIFDALKNMAIIHKSGGGVGFSFSNLRPRGDIVKSTNGVASGPVSFMRIFNTATDVIKQGGKRRGANMGILNVNHPDIIEFINAKQQEEILNNFNLSVALSDEFMEKLVNGEEYDLINPRNGKKSKSLATRDVFELIVKTAWKSGDPGVIFMDEVNRNNPTPWAGKIEATNPCAEQPLLNYESCNLGSINLVKMVKKRKIDFNKLKNTVEAAVHFLDNVIDVNNFPTSRIRSETLKNRKIGLGIMGFAEMLIMLGIPYDSGHALDTAQKIMKFINFHARETSARLGTKRGSFPNFKGSIWDEKGYNAMRNATVTTVAPTGTISIIADVTSGIEPLFGVTFIRNVMEGTMLLEINKIFEDVAKNNGFYNKELMAKIAEKGSIQDISEIDDSIKRIFVTALDIEPEWHVKMQGAFQKHVDNAVSKTVNLPPDATPEEVKKVILLAYKLKCKGITVYRYGSKKQVLYLNKFPDNDKLYLSADSQYSGGCSCPY